MRTKKMEIENPAACSLGSSMFPMTFGRTGFRTGCREERLPAGSDTVDLRGGFKVPGPRAGTFVRNQIKIRVRNT